MNEATSFWGETQTAIMSGVIGVVLTILVTKFLAKTARIRYSTSVERVATSADDSVFGEVRVQWQGQVARNLYLATVEVENVSSRDFSNVGFKVYTDDGTLLLNERTSVVNSPNIVRWSDAYREKTTVPAGQQPTTAQWDIYNHSREYSVEVFNRRQVLQLTYLCSRPHDDSVPALFVDMQHVGVKLVHHAPANVVFGVPQPQAAWRGLALTVGTVVLVAYLNPGPWVVGVASAVVGLVAQWPGALLYKAERWVRDVVSG